MFKFSAELFLPVLHVLCSKVDVLETTSFSLFTKLHKMICRFFFFSREEDVIVTTCMWSIHQICLRCSGRDNEGIPQHKVEMPFHRFIVGLKGCDKIKSKRLFYYIFCLLLFIKKVLCDIDVDLLTHTDHDQYSPLSLWKQRPPLRQHSHSSATIHSRALLLLKPRAACNKAQRSKAARLPQ